MIQKVYTIVLSIFLWVSSVTGAEFKQFNQRELYAYFEGKQRKTGAIVSPFEEGGLKYQKFINSFEENPNEYLGKTIMLGATRTQEIIANVVYGGLSGVLLDSHAIFELHSGHKRRHLLGAV